MKEEEIIKNVKEIVYNAECWIDDEEYTGAEEREWAEFEKSAIQGLLDLYEKEKEKNKELLEGLKYRVNYCKLLEKELYEDTDMEYEMELTKIEQKYIQELLNKEE